MKQESLHFGGMGGTSPLSAVLQKRHLFQIAEKHMK